MNVRRYILAGSASILLHSLLLSASESTQEFAIPLEVSNPSVTLNLTAMLPPNDSKLEQKTLEPKVTTSKETVQREQSSEVTPMTADAIKASSAPSMIKKKKKSTHEEKEPHAKQEKHIKQNQNSPTKENIARTNTLQKKSYQDRKKNTQEASQVDNKSQVDQPKATAQSSEPPSQPILIKKTNFITKPVQPRYPRSARKRGIEGVALYEIWLDKNGKQVKQILIQSSGAKILDSSALKAIKQWQFSPYISDGQSIAHRIQIPVRFRLDG
ncbi:energy transducer TonB [Vibrio sagamiensis]|uniref:Cell envelope protein TonB n=1 Tax=Vibrio sagamiensis NBRC 104589 TaxID=1219064 RepID=A0A511QF54_9VIBR|nr:energy transducer TonB [Vibrio sagamiensis]PNQ60908.1 energy transducer TonB [Vibrio agarivorans]GEM75796.1 cell envelope protein TonB [Vibrio sagamiensis NBRC 104589]